MSPRTGKTGAKTRPARGRPGSPRISEAEWAVMRIVWRQPPVTANQVTAALATRMQWKPRTVQTLLSRLVRKGVLHFKKQGREYWFSPAVKESDCVHRESRSFLQRVFGGELAPFLATFLEREPLSESELAELRRILDEKSS
jgi:BlaI family penicillinase repressor